jgi:hypothetical protein
VEARLYPEVIKNRISEFEPNPGRPLSVDFEFRPGIDGDWSNPELTIAGLCAGGSPHSAFWDDRAEQKIKELEEKEPVWLGHNALTVERSIIGNLVGHEIPVERVEDSMLRHYLCNAELCKGVVKSSGEDEDDDQKEKGMGFNDLWSMASLYTDLPQWKQCRGTNCAGPCPTHDPLGYNGVDCVAPDVALPRLKAEMVQKRIPESLYENLKKLTLMCHAMSEKGIKVDRQLVAQLEEQFNERKDKIFPSKWQAKIGKKGQELKTKELVWDAPFNPRSPKAVIEWFGKHGIQLGSTEKDDIQEAVRRASISDAASTEAIGWLEKLYDYKDAGKGLKAWTSERYFDKWGFAHPRFIVTGTSTGRLSSANPNFQNVPRVGFGKQVRRVVIPRDPSLMLVKADKSQLELRMCLWYAGFDVKDIPNDAFTWLVENGGGVFEEAEKITKKGWKPRDHAKSVSHGADYGEGIKVLSGKDLDNPRTKRLIDSGALVVHRDWPFHGGLIGFTGINLAERLFGSATWENRAKANSIQEAYFKKFGAIREWHKKVSREVEQGYIRTASGRYLTLLGTPEDKLKIAFAVYGQGGGSDDVQSGMLRYWKEGHIPILMVHDELVFEFPKETPNDTLLDFFSVMSAECEYMPGFRCPVKVQKGPNWLDMEEVGKI